MKTVIGRLHFKSIMLLIWCLVLKQANAQTPTPVINNAVVLENQGKLSKVEIGVDITGTYSYNTIIPVSYINPFDWDQIRIKATMTHVGTNEQYVINAFYYDDFEFMANPDMTPCRDGSGNCPLPLSQAEFLTHKSTMYPFRVRFSPPRNGWWEYRLDLHFMGAIVQQVYGEFEVDETDAKGFIRRTLELYAGAYKFDNGEAYFPTGSNLHFYNYGYCAKTWQSQYLGTIDNLNNVNGNFARLLMFGDAWAGNMDGRVPFEGGFIFNIEWGASAPLGEYHQKQNIAFLLDRMVEYTKQKNINLQLTLFNYDEGKSIHSPLHDIAAVAADHETFYTNQAAKDFTLRKLRYIASRWGYATNIFAWELLAEGDLGSSLTNRLGWIHDMANALKDLDPNHMILLSMGAEYFEYNPQDYTHQAFSDPNIDIMDHHTYGSSELYNFSFFRRENALLKANYHSKPILAGEFGKGGTNKPELLLEEHSRRPVDKNNEYHNSIWASSFSGQSGTSSPWFPYIFGFNSPSYRHIKPLRVLIEEMDLTNNYYSPISSGCQPATEQWLGMSAADLAFFSSPNNNTTGGGGYGASFNECNYTVFNQSIKTVVPNNSGAPELNYSKLFVEGLKNDNDIFGWMHKKDNFWWKIPHLGSAALGGTMVDPEFDHNCAYYLNSSNRPINAAACQNYPLENAHALFEDVCEGEYYIDFYSTYPSTPLTKGGSPADGGIIPDFTRRVFSQNNVLDVKLPTFKPLKDNTSAPDEADAYAPDYGYHIRKVKNFEYLDTHIGQYAIHEEADPNGDIERFSIGSQIFFQGKNDGGLMHQHYWNSTTSQWEHSLMNSYQPASEAIDGDISVEHHYETRVDYRGVDAKMNTYWFDPSQQQWIHAWQGGSSAPASEDVHVSSKIASTGDQVFYRGAADSRLHMYFHNGSSWQHTILNPSAGANELVVGDVKVLDNQTVDVNIVFYRSPNNTISYYIRNGSNGTPWIYGEVDPGPTPSNEEAVGDILPVELNGWIYVFYVGADGYIQYHRTTAITTGPLNPGWDHGYLGRTVLGEAASLNTALDFDDNILYYHGDNGSGDYYIHRYYWDGGDWRHAAIVLCPNPPYSNDYYLPNFRAVNNDIVYVGQDNKVRMQWAGDGSTCEKCTGIFEPAYKMPTDDNDKKYGLGMMTKFRSDDNKYSLIMYPNPATDQVNVILGNSSDENIIIKMFNSMGVLVYEKQVNSTSRQFSIPAQHFPKGLYTVTLFETTGKPVTTQKLSLY